MVTSFRAVLVQDVFYKDFRGTNKRQQAGLPVVITPLRISRFISKDTLGRIVTERVQSFIATRGKISFYVEPLAFQRLI